MPERFANNAVSILTSVIDGVTDPVALTVQNASGFPSDGNFRILIDSEILLVTSVAGNSFTADRGLEGTQVAAHDAGATVRHIFTAGALETKFSETILTGPYNNIPAAGVTGRTYYCTDSPYMLVDDGLDWIHFAGGYQVTPPDIADFSWVNQGTATAVSTYGGLLIADAVANSNTFDVAMLVKTPPSPSYSCVFGFIPYYTGIAYHLPATVQRQSSDGKLVTFRIGTHANMYLEMVYDNASGPTSAASAQMIRGGSVFVSYPTYIKITDDGTTNRKYYISNNPYLFPQEYYSVSRTQYATPDQVGFCVNTFNQPQACHWIHYSEGP